MFLKHFLLCSSWCDILFYSGSFDILFYDGFKKTVQGINIKMMPKDVQQQVSNLHNSVSHDE